MICPFCKGAKQVSAMVDCADRRQSGYRVLDCHVCKGAVEITDERAQRIADGKRLRDDRVARGVGMRQEAERLGMTPQALSAIENGREVKA